jgi:hypothetical protein
VLTFRPYVGEDGVVRMEIHPKDSTGGLTTANLPFEQTTEVTTNIMVKDGHTILIGGLFREVSTATRGQVPLLGNIPVLGAASAGHAMDSAGGTVLLIARAQAGSRQQGRKNLARTLNDSAWGCGRGCSGLGDG